MSTDELKNIKYLKIILYLLFFTPSLTKGLIAPGIALSDITLLTSVSLAFLFLRSKDFFIIPTWVFYGFFIYLWILITAFFAYQYSIFFASDEFFKSFFKYSFYFLSVSIISIFLKKIDIKIISKIMLNVVFINSIIGVYILFSQLLKDITGIQIPYNFFWLGHDGPLSIGEDLDRWTIGNIMLVKLRGQFGEPSLYAISQVLMLTFIYLKDEKLFKESLYKISFVIFTLFLTVSLTAYFLIFLLIVCIFIKDRKFFLTLKNIRIGVFSIMIFLIFAELSPVAPSKIFNQLILNRTSEVIGGTDRSSVKRLYGSLDTASYVIERSPIYGSSLGNVDIFFDKSGGQLSYITGRDEQIDLQEAVIHNIPLYYLASLGYIGFFLFLGSLLFVIRASTFIGALPFLASLAATGTLLEASFWVLYLLFSSNFRLNK